MTIDDIEATYLSSWSPAERRRRGVTFTPQWIVDLMIGLARLPNDSDFTVVDAGAGAGKFTIASARAFPGARVLAFETDPTLASALQKLVRRSGFGGRVSVVKQDFLVARLPTAGRRLFIGNPPYVRHHSLGQHRKAWLVQAGKSLGTTFSGLAGLHVYFLLRCLVEARAGDRFVMVLPSEWLETRYGAELKGALLARASSITLHVFPPGVQVFEGTMTTSIVLDVVCGTGDCRVLAGLIDPSRKSVVRQPVTAAMPNYAAERANWLHLAWNATGCERNIVHEAPGTVPLGDLFRIHRGQVTGMNSVWIANRETEALIPRRFQYPCITDGTEIFTSESGSLDSDTVLRRVIDLPEDLSDLEPTERPLVNRFLDYAKRAGAADTYIAKHRKPWWKVGLREAPPIVMSYMARHAPKFALNRCSARLLNIAHGLYPTAALTDMQLEAMVSWLNTSLSSRVGRTYAGGLVKIEPSDAMRIRVPDPFAAEARLAA